MNIIKSPCKDNPFHFFLSIEGFEVNLFIVNVLFIVTALNPGQIQLKKNCSDAAANRGSICPIGYQFYDNTCIMVSPFNFKLGRFSSNYI